jgi:nucleotide-binding universal stress UspA family protein
MNFPFKKILCPVAFDDQEGAALEAAKQLVAAETTIYLLYVVPSLPAMGEPRVAKSVEDEKPSEAEAQKRLKDLTAQRMSGVKCETLTLDAFPGDTAKAVLEAAKDINPDLIVMPTHGRIGLRRLVLGSVTEGVVREAACPVLTIRTSVGQAAPKARAK